MLNLERGLGVTVEGFLQLTFNIQQQYANKPNKMLASIRGVMRRKKALFYLAYAQLKFCVQFHSPLPQQPGRRQQSRSVSCKEILKYRTLKILFILEQNKLECYAWNLQNQKGGGQTYCTTKFPSTGTWVSHWGWSEISLNLRENTLLCE